MSTPAMTISQVAAATPAGRDRYVDFLRALSIAVVVLGHWLMAIIYLDDGRLTGANALDVVPGLWILTWVLQVMPLFFFAGGFSNYVSWRGATRRGEGYQSFLRARVERLMRPTLVFIVVWALGAAMLRIGAPQLLERIGLGAELIAKPLWFLAVYVLVTAAAPVMFALHLRHRARVLAALVAAAVATDVVRIAVGVTALGYLNFAFVWLFAHQLGFFYSDGTFGARTRSFFATVAAAGLGALVTLTASGIYSPSMVGMAGEKVSNNSPPSVCLIALTLWLVGLAMLARGPVSRWLARPAPWKAVVGANAVIMTVLLWHLTALLVAAVVLLPLGFPQPAGGTALWWAWRPIWIGVLIVFLVSFVAIFGRAESRGLLAVRSVSSPGRRGAQWRIAVGLAALIAGLAGLAEQGFALGEGDALTSLVPLVSAGLTISGYLLISPRSASALGG